MKRGSIPASTSLRLAPWLMTGFSRSVFATNFSWWTER